MRKKSNRKRWFWLVLLAVIVFPIILVKGTYSGNTITRHWAAKSFSLLIQRGIINEGAYQNIDPDAPITRQDFVNLADKVARGPENLFGGIANPLPRAEAVVFIAKRLRLPAAGSAVFSDIRGVPDSTLIESMREHKLISGYPNGSFRPGDNMTYAEAYTLMAHVISQGLYTPPAASVTETVLMPPTAPHPTLSPAPEAAADSAWAPVRPPGDRFSSTYTLKSDNTYAQSTLTLTVTPTITLTQASVSASALTTTLTPASASAPTSTLTPASTSEPTSTPAPTQVSTLSPAPTTASALAQTSPASSGTVRTETVSFRVDGGEALNDPANGSPPSYKNVDLLYSITNVEGYHYNENNIDIIVAKEPCAITYEGVKDDAPLDPQYALRPSSPENYPFPAHMRISRTFYITPGEFLSLTDYTNFDHICGRCPLAFGQPLKEGVYTISCGNFGVGETKVLVVEKSDYGDLWPHESLTAKPISSMVYIDGKEVSFEAYNIDGFDCFKLRDIAFQLNGTERQFDVSWDYEENETGITRFTPYTIIGGEMAVADGSEKTASRSLRTIVEETGGYKNYFELTAYNIDGVDYFPLQYIAGFTYFSIDWDYIDGDSINISW